MVCEGNSTTQFTSNIAKNTNDGFGGGAIYSHANINIVFKGNSTAIFSNNTAKRSGGALSCHGSCTISVYENTSLVFNNNQAYSGGSVHVMKNSHFIIDGSAEVTFSSNIATLGRVL